MSRSSAAHEASLATGPSSVPPHVIEVDRVDFRWGCMIKMRDGVSLHATLYLPRGQQGPSPGVFTMTPYTAQNYHLHAMRLAALGIPFLAIDCRGRGNSEGRFTPFVNEAADCADVIEWIAGQPWCSGKVSMWGGSYGGFNQWLAAAARPKQLATIVPVASPHQGTDFPMRGNIGYCYILTWNLYVSGRALQQRYFDDLGLWGSLWKRRFEAGLPFETLGEEIGFDCETVKEWIAHPMVDPYFDEINPSDAEYSAIDMPILTITGHFDSDQTGALEHYRRHLAASTRANQERHFLVVGPWNHAGTRAPTAELDGMEFGPDSLVDLDALHADWYRWTMSDGHRPTFLRDRVAYYVTGAEKWRYAPSLAAVTVEHAAFYLDSRGDAGSIVHSGRMGRKPGAGAPDSYVYDPRNLPDSLQLMPMVMSPFGEQRPLWTQDGKQLVYHSTAFERDTEISGCFRLSAWIAIDQPDTDFQVTVYDVMADGRAVTLATDVRRARHRESLRAERLIETADPLCYVFDGFNFTSRRISKGSRLRLIIEPINCAGMQKNYNADTPVRLQTMADSRTVKVELWHDDDHPSALYVPFAAPEEGVTVLNHAMPKTVAEVEARMGC